MKSYEVKGIVFGEGRTKIALPVTGGTKEEVMGEIKECLAQKPDVIEWRIDHYLRSFVRTTGEKGRLAEIPEDFLEFAKEVYAACGVCPLLVTFRTGEEGGELHITRAAYSELLLGVAKEKAADFIDVESRFYEEETECASLCRALKEEGIVVIGSNHDFEKTLQKDALVKRFLDMEALGMDIAKVAMMPRSAQDVLVLMVASREAMERMQIPVISMSMGEIGKISRLSGQISGSCVTFACLSRTSAPGQIPIPSVKEFLGVLNETE